MESVFEAFISNPALYSAGHLVGETLHFPTNTEEVQSLLKRIGVDGVRCQEYFIISFDSDILGLYDYLGEYENIDELNHLAHLLKELSPSERETLEAVMDSGQHCGSVQDLINLTQNLDCYDLHPGVDNEEMLGRLYVEDMESLEVPDNIKPYFDFEAYGRDISINENGHFAPGGYVTKQEQGFVSSLALGYNEVEIQRGMTTSSTAIFIPFMTRELRMDGQALYYGMNALSHNVIMADRKKLKSANGMYLGSTGSGKSFAAKRELLNVFLTIPQDRIIIVDPMGEYAPLVRRLGGQVIEIAPDSPHHLNPMDVELNMAAGESPLSMKADFLLSLCELVVGGKEGLQPIEKTVVDRCVRLVYREQALGLDTGKTPLLQDLYEELLKQPEPEARRVATALELYCTGSLNLFNHPTNVKTDSRVVCIVLKNMGENLRKIAMHITNEFVSQAVDTNFREGVATWCYFDEFHVLLRDPLTASYFVAVWKMLRKKGCVPSALTQNVKDLLASREIENILDNTDFMILLSQAQSDRAILARQLGISEHQLSYITHSNSGEGLLFYGNVTIPFVDRFPKGEIYDLLTTRPEDMKNEAKTE